METAQALLNTVNVKVEECEGRTVLTVSIKDFDDYWNLPAALDYKGIKCGKSGWNSDRMEAYYQSSNSMYAYKIGK